MARKLFSLFFILAFSVITAKSQESANRIKSPRPNPDSLINADYKIDDSVIRQIAVTNPTSAAVIADCNRDNWGNSTWQKVYYPPVKLSASDIEWWLRPQNDQEVKKFFEKFDAQGQTLFQQGKDALEYEVTLSEVGTSVTVTVSAISGIDPYNSPFKQMRLVTDKQDSTAQIQFQ